MDKTLTTTKTTKAGAVVGSNGKQHDEVINKRVPVAGLKPHPRNYNAHDDGQIEDLRESLRQFGQVRSIVVQATKQADEFLIVAGHGVTEAARLEGVKTIKADVIPASWRPARVLAYLAADNELARRGNPDQAQLAALVAEVQRSEGDVLARLAAGEQKALDALLINPLLLSVDDAFAALPDEDRAPFQQITFTLHDTQVEQVKRSLKLAIKQGEFVGTLNENSNGNALSRICETYLTTYGDG